MFKSAVKKELGFFGTGKTFLIKIFPDGQYSCDGVTTLLIINDHQCREAMLVVARGRALIGQAFKEECAQGMILILRKNLISPVSKKNVAGMMLIRRLEDYGI